MVHAANSANRLADIDRVHRPRAQRAPFADRPGGLVYTSKLKPGAAGHKEERRLKWRRRLPGPSAHRPQEKTKIYKTSINTTKGVGGLRSPHLQYSLIHSVVILGRGSSQISDLHLQSPISNVVILGRIQSDLRSPSPISNLQSRFGGPGEEGGSNLQGDALWIH